MEATLTIIWFIALLISIASIFEFVGMSALTDFFPEGRRWWQLPVQFLTLAIFAVLVLVHPF